MRCSHSISFLLGLLTGAASLLFATRGAAVPWLGGTEMSIPISGASVDLSGATWNTVSQSLWVVRQNKQLWEYAYNSGTGNFDLLRTLVLPSNIGIGGDIEAVAQVDHSAANEIYTLSENKGRIARVVGLDVTPTLAASWNLEVTNNGHALPPEVLLQGAEGLEFVPDANLLAAGFRFPDGSAFTGSTKGMGGLMFVGHQIEGRLHVFDLNPNVSEDFINYGSFLTKADEIAGLHYDRTDGHMYLWHNPSSQNSLEISTLSSNLTVGTIDRYLLFLSGAPPGNVEGIALVDPGSCGEFGAAASDRLIFFTRDSEAPNLPFYTEFPCQTSSPVISALGFAERMVVVLLVVSAAVFLRHRAPPAPSAASRSRSA